MKRKLFAVIAAVVLMSGCTKNNQVTPPAVPNSQPTVKNSISGVISPATAITDLALDLAVNGQHQTFHAQPSGTGAFNFSDLPEGTGNLSLVAATGYSTPSPLQVSFQSVTNINFGTIVIPLTPGTLSGLISPAGAAMQVLLQPAGTSTGAITLYPDAVTGTFKSTNVPPGAYTVGYKTSAGYSAPAVQNIQIASGQDLDLGALKFTVLPKGSISGSVTPAASVLSVQAFLVGNGLTYSVKPDAAGNFSIPDMVSGVYALTVNPVLGSTLYPPSYQTITVAAGQNTDVGKLLLTTSPQAPFYCFINGKLGSAPSPAAQYSSAKRTLNLVTSVLGGSMTLHVEGVTGPGNYACTSFGSSYITYSTPPTASYMAAKTWNTALSGGSGVIIITAIDQQNQTISGTFSGILAPVNSTDGNTAVNAGAFTALHYSN